MSPTWSSSLSLILEVCKWGGNHIIMINKKETVVSDFKIMSDLLYSRGAEKGLSFEKTIKKFLSLCSKMNRYSMMPASHVHISVIIFISYYICIL